VQQPPSRPRPPHSRGFQITHNDAPQSVGLHWTSDGLVAQACTSQHTVIHALSVEFELTVSAGERPHSYALDHVATGTGL